jgi:hypothetical protein
MDLRDIQRLHAQFAPDMITIDLPRQIAALPAPTDMVANDVAPTMRRRWPQTGPVVRGSIVAVAGAAFVGMAGMGAASLYKTFSGSHVPATVATDASTKADSTRPTVAPVAAPVTHADKLKDIDAAPAQPLITAPGLNASDLTDTSPLGITADQFRKSLKTGTTPTQSVNPSPAPAQLTAESERAAVSPIHRNSPRTSVAPSIAPTLPAAAPVSVAAPALLTAPSATVAKSAESVVVQQVPQQVVTVSAAAASQPLQAVVAAPAAPATPGTTGATAKLTHPARHHVSKRRVDPDSAPESNVPARAITPSAPASRTGSNEVQMF